MRSVSDTLITGRIFGSAFCRPRGSRLDLVTPFPETLEWLVLLTGIFFQRFSQIQDCVIRRVISRYENSPALLKQDFVLMGVLPDHGIL